MSLQINLLLHPVVDPLLLLCETSGSTTQVTIDCQVNRPLSGTFCSFDGGYQHKCESEVCENNLRSAQNSSKCLSYYRCYDYRSMANDNQHSVRAVSWQSQCDHNSQRHPRAHC